ncbi:MULTISPECIES: hypothetical protein [Leptolyngbya]|nr:hypothetical protein [Leptolyngbya sp. FACHB-1624]
MTCQKLCSSHRCSEKGFPEDIWRSRDRQIQTPICPALGKSP